MKSKMIKFLGVLLSVLMVMSLVPAVYAEEDEPVDVPEHTWAEPAYEWNDDCTACYAEMVCEDEPELTVSETSEKITILEQKEADCEEDGYVIYEAEFENEAFENQQKTVVLPATGHDWGDWEVDTPAAEGVAGIEKRYCRNDDSHVEEREIPAIMIDYKLWVNGEQIKTDNKTIDCGEGKAEYDSGTNTLTLENAEITNSYEYAQGQKALIYSEVRNLHIVLKGENVLKGVDETPNSFDAGNGCNLSIKGEGTLDINNVARGIYLEGGSFECDGATLNIEAKNATGLWVGKDITFNNSKVKIATKSPYFNAVVSEVDGTISVTDSEVEIQSKRAAVHFGSGDDDSSEHKLVVNSGSLKIESGSDYGIFVWNYRNPETGVSQPNGKVIVNGGTVDITSASGGTNVADITIGDKMNFSEGEALTDSGRVVLTDGLVEYKLWVNGARFTSEKTQTACGSGTASYDARKRVLTLENAEIGEGYEFVERNTALIYSEIEHLTIELKGKSVLSGSAVYGINTAAGCNVSITGSGSLEIDAVDNGVRVGNDGTEGGSFSVKDAALKIEAKSGTGLWVNKDINITNSEVEVVTDSRYFNAVVSNYDGTITINDSQFTAGSRRAAVHFGSGDEDNSTHRFVMNSGTLKLESSADYGIYIGSFRDQYTGETAINGSVYVNGMVEIDSMFGGTNLSSENVSFGEDMVFTQGESLGDKDKVIVKLRDMIFPVFIAEKKATCTEDGVKAHYADGNLLFEDRDGKSPIEDAQTLVVPATGHKWSEPECEWTNDGTVTEVKTCENDETHVEIRTAEYSTIIIKGATCVEPGEMIDVADFGEGDSVKQVRRTHAIPATGHKWGEPEYEWSGDFKTCTARVICENDPGHIMEETTTNITSESGSELPGSVVYTAVFENAIFGEAVCTSIGPTGTEPEPSETVEPTEPSSGVVEPTEPASVEPTESIAPTEQPTTEPAATEPMSLGEGGIKAKYKANPIKVTAKKKTVKANKLSKKKVSVKLITIKNAKGKVTVKLVKKGTASKLYKKITVSKKGVITLKKGKYKKGTYKIKLKITAKGNSKYIAKSVTKTVKVKVK